MGAGHKGPALPLSDGGSKPEKRGPQRASSPGLPPLAPPRAPAPLAGAPSWARALPPRSVLIWLNVATLTLLAWVALDVRSGQSAGGGGLLPLLPPSRQQQLQQQQQLQADCVGGGTTACTPTGAQQEGWAAQLRWRARQGAEAGGAAGAAALWCSSRRRVGAATVFSLSRCQDVGTPVLDRPSPLVTAPQQQQQQQQQEKSDGQGQQQRQRRYATAEDLFPPPAHDPCPLGTRGAAWPAVLIATVALNNQSFGLVRDQGLINKGPRGLEGFLDMLADQDYPKCRLSLALLVSSEDFFPAASAAVSRFARRHGLARAVVALRSVDAGVGEGGQAERHDASVQRRRRGALARLRNAALSLALGPEEAVFWVDSDITAMPPHTLGALVDSGKDIVTAVTKGWDEVVYDLNAWRLPRRTYDPQEGSAFVPGPVPGVSKLPQDLEGGPDPFVPLDSVGGCTTLVKADVHREGALFTPYYAVGTAWGREGHDGLESEGLCYQAAFLGRSCWLATRIVTYHQSYWIAPEPSPAPGAAANATQPRAGKTAAAAAGAGRGGQPGGRPQGDTQPRGVQSAKAESP